MSDSVLSLPGSSSSAHPATAQAVAASHVGGSGSRSHWRASSAQNTGALPSATTVASATPASSTAEKNAAW